MTPIATPSGCLATKRRPPSMLPCSSLALSSAFSPFTGVAGLLVVGLMLLGLLVSRKSFRLA